MSAFLEAVIALSLIISGIFGLVGSFGLIKLDDAMSRLHSPTKATTLGVGGVVIASMAHAILFEGRVSVHELLIALFLFITAPITAHFIAKAHLHRDQNPDELPKAGKDKCWAVYDVDDNQSNSDTPS